VRLGQVRDRDTHGDLHPSQIVREKPAVVKGANDAERIFEGPGGDAEPERRVGNGDLIQYAVSPASAIVSPPPPNL